MISRYSVIASMFMGLIGGNADAGCFGKRVNQCQSAPVCCVPCAPAVCNPQYHVAPTPIQLCNPCASNPVACGTAPAHEGPAFPGVSALAPLGVDSLGNVVTSVGSLRSTVSDVVGDSFDVESFLKDLLTDKLRTPPGVNKNAVTTGTISQEQLNQILAPYRRIQN